MSTSLSKRRRRLLAGLAAAALTLPASAAAQHGLPPAGPALHERLEAADAVAVASVDSVEPGRLRVRDARALRGSVPERFAIKRSPSRPPPLGVGDRALLLLRGARPPFVLAGEPAETIRLVGPQMERRWTDAVLALLRARNEPDALARVYLGWIDAGPETLRAQALRALMRGDAPWAPLPDAVLLERASVAIDGARPVEARRASARLAMLQPRATARVAAAVPLAPGRADAVVVGLGLRGALLHRLPEAEGALRRSLGHPEPEIRTAALRSLASTGGAYRGPVPPELARLAAEDSDPRVRREAERALRALQRGG